MSIKFIKSIKVLSSKTLQIFKFFYKFRKKTSFIVKIFLRIIICGGIFVSDVEIRDPFQEIRRCRRLYGVQGFPTKVVVDPQGKVAKIIVGEAPAFYDYLDEVLQ